MTQVVLRDVAHQRWRVAIGLSVMMVMIYFGFILLLDTTEIISFDRIARFWPVGLIGIGVYMLYNRMNPPSESSDAHSANGGTR